MKDQGVYVIEGKNYCIDTVEAGDLMEISSFELSL
jgi:hypothetical protein